MENILEIIGTLVGIIYLIYEYRASAMVWIAGIIMPAIYIFVYFNAGLYADFGINIYYLIIAIYGYFAWKYGGKKDKTLPITYTPIISWIVCIVAFIVSFFAIGYILVNFTDSNVPWLDSFTTAMSIVGIWMLARKYIEQWFVWLIVDIVSSALYVYKGIYFTAGLYFIYSIVAIFGYFKWKRLMDNESN